MVRLLSKEKCVHMAEALLSLKIDRKAVHFGNDNHIHVCIYILYIYFLLLFGAAIIMLLLPWPGYTCEQVCSCI